MSDEVVMLVTYRYLWQLRDSDVINVKVLTDVPSAHDEFCERVLKSGDVVRFGREYVHEMNVDLLGRFETLFPETFADAEEVC